MRLLVIPALALAACTPSAAEQGQIDRSAAVTQTRLDAALAGLVPGEPTSCLPLVRAQQVQTQGFGPVILHKVGRKKVYRNDTGGGCERIARGDILVTHQFAGQLCTGDIATTVDPVSRIMTGSCAMGRFTPYRRP